MNTQNVVVGGISQPSIRRGTATWNILVLGLAVLVLGTSETWGQSAGGYPVTTAISGGRYYHALALKSDGSVWAWGDNSLGELGIGSTNDSSVPVQVSQTGGPTNAAAVAGGSEHSLCLTSNGVVWAWGGGIDGELGNGGTSDSTVPVRVTGLTNVTAITAGAYHSLVLSNGMVWAWGWNNHGQLGNGNLNSGTTPGRANGLTSISAIAAGKYHSLALSNGLIWAWGLGGDGQLGNAASNSSSNAVPVSGLASVTKVVGGGYHCLALSNGCVWAWGNNQYGQVGDGTTNSRSIPVLVVGLSNIIDIAGGLYFSAAVKSDGSVWIWGDSTQGLIEYAQDDISLTPLRIPTLRNIAAVSAGRNFLLSLRKDGTVWSWGYNDLGQLGEDTTQSHTVPVAVETLTILPPGTPSPVARNTRFKRGHGADQTYYSCVIPLNGQKGVKLNPTGGNADVLFKTNTWSNQLYHFNNDDTGPSPLPFKNPIVAFGSRVGGSSLYCNQSYNFGVYAGDPSANYTNAIAIEVYNKSDFSLVSTYYVPVPTVNQTNAWASYLTNGWTATTNAYGLTTTVYFSQPITDWGTDTNGAYLLTHTAVPTNYFYLIQIRGQVGADLMVTQNSTNWWSRLYTLEFETHPPWRAVYIDQPQFEGQPMPAVYQGKTADELLSVSAVVSNTVSLVPSTCTTIDQSPELRRHPILDQFVLDMGKDPMALVNYVLNEIGLTDAIAYDDSGAVDDKSINLGGVNRSALGTYLEGQGSPTEQCALLVYLLRQAGVPACYLYPTHNGLQMLDARISKLLRMQFKGLVDDWGIPLSPQLIPVNYPWVAAYVSTNNGVSTNWVHIFPWLKDTEMVEGLDLYKYMPSNYNSGYKWLKQYCLGDSNIMSLATDADTPLVLLPKFLQDSLLTNYPGVSVDDIGMKIVDRPHYYSRWSDLPTPTLVTNSSVAIESLGSSSITNVSPSMTNIFDTVSVEIYSTVNSNSTRLATGDMMMVDLHNRKFLLRHEWVTNSNPVKYRMILSLAAYRPDTTNPVSFASVHFLDKTDTNVLNNVVTTNILNSTDDNLVLNIVQNRHRSFTGLIAYDAWSYFPGFWEAFSTVNTRLLRKGDLAAICLNVGRVSRKMLDVHAGEFWKMEKDVQANPSLTNTLSAEVYQGTTAFLMGMAYHERVSRFESMSEGLHKVHFISKFESGLALLHPKRVSGSLPAGNLILIQPAVDMLTRTVAMAGNGTMRPDEGGDLKTSQQDYMYQVITDGSAQEHQIINTYFKEAAAISTVKLLQIAQKGTNSGGPGVLFLNHNNYLNYGTSNYNGVQLRNHDATTWNAVTNTFATSFASNFVQVLITPGAQTNSSGSYKGMGVMILDANAFSAYISGNYIANGGFGSYLLDFAFQPVNITSLSLNLNEWGNFYVDLYSPTASQPQAAPDLFTWFAAPVQQNSAANQVLSPSQTLADLQAVYSLGIIPGTDTANRVNFVAAVSYIGVFGPDSNLRQVGENTQDPVSVLSGEFHIDEVDLGLPGPMPLQVRRNYSSQNLAPNQFGYGWKLDYMPYLSVSTNGNIIYAADPDGAVIAYVKTNSTLWVPSPDQNPRLNNRTTGGIGGSANAFNSRIQSSAVGSTNFYKLYSQDGSLRTFQVMSFTNTYTNSRPFLITWQDAMGNAWSVDYGTDKTQPDFGQARRIRSSNGSFLGFYFDWYGHVIETYTGDGRRLQYEYDRFGDLVTVTLPDDSQRTYEYEHKTVSVSGTNQTYSSHLILKENKPEGRTLVNVYDDQRRVTNQLSTVGQDLTPVLSATFVYSNNFKFTNTFTNTITGYTVVKDALNNPTRYDYTSGLITSITNPLNQAVLQDWYMPNETNKTGYYPRSLETVIDPRGLITQYRYDTNGNPTNITVTGDLTGNGNTNDQAVTTKLYDTNNLVLLLIDPSGTTNKLIYTNTWLLSRVETYPTNSAPANWLTNNFGYCNVTNVVNTGAGLATNQAFGLLWQTIRAFNSSDAATTEWVYDGRGFVTQETKYAGTGDPDIVTQFAYNGRDELVERTDAAGRKVRFGYDDMGRPEAKEVYEAGQTSPLSWEYSYYDDNGELVWTDGPRSDPEDYVWRDYDGGGRKTTELHWRSQAKSDGSGVEAPGGDALYATSFWQWDKVGNLLRQTDPLGVYTTNAWDALGHLLSQATYETNGTLLSTNAFAYGPRGDVTNAYNALGGLTIKQYTWTGQPKYQQNPDGSTNAWRYLPDGRVQREILQNGNYSLTTYDDANRKVTKVFYSVANGALATNVTEYDRRGNAVRVTDAEANVFTNRFDGLDRIKLAAGPVVVAANPPGGPGLPGGSPTSAQQISRYAYDASGQILVVTNNLGETTTTTSDALGRPVKVEIKGADNVTVRLTTTSYAANGHSATVTSGSGGNAIASTAYSDNDGHPVLTVHSPGNGLLEFESQSYDVAGNRLLWQQLSGAGSQITTWATNAWTWDGLHRIVTESVRDGVCSTNAYDTLGNALSRAMPNAVTWSASYANDSRMLTQQDAGGGLTARSFTYQYFPANSAFAGKLQLVTDGRSVNRTNSYDDFLRLASVNTGGSGAAAEQKMSLSYQYDRRGLITALTQSFATNTTGPQTVVQREFNGVGQLFEESISIDGIAQSAMSQTWDNAGRRTVLGRSGLAQGFGYRADGLLTNVFSPPFAVAYGYGDNGYLARRYTPARDWQMTSRDGRGRLLGATTVSWAQTALTETIAYQGDGRLSTYSAVRGTDFTDARAYAYAPSSQFLSKESLYLGSGLAATNNYTFDFGQGSGLGVLTSAALSGAATNYWGLPTNGVDGLRRPIKSTNSFVRTVATGKVNGPASVSATMNGRPVGVLFDPTPTNGGRWSASVEAGPGTNTLVATATHPSGLFSASTTNKFNNTITSQSITNQYDGNGNVTTRVSTIGLTSQTNTFTWDAFDRLVKETMRDNHTNGYDRTCIYDGLGRRIRTIHSAILTNITQPTVTIDSHYDPSVEFLEVEMVVNGKGYWKVYGPDLNGAYGGLQGIGGLEAVVDEAGEQVTAFVSDHFGNVIATNRTDQSGTAGWLPARFSSYGPVSGYQQGQLSLNTGPATVFGYLGKRVDETGRICFGAREFMPDERRWLSYDSAGWAGGHPYVFGGGCPSYFYDPDGRCVRQQRPDLDAIDAFFDARRLARHQAELDNDRENLWSSMARQGRAEAYAEQESAHLKDLSDSGFLSSGAWKNLGSSGSDLTWSQQWKYNSTAMFDASLANMANLVTLGAANSGSIALTGSDLRGNGGYSTGERLWQGTMTAAMFAPGLGLGSRAEGLAGDSYGAFLANSYRADLALGERAAARSEIPTIGGRLPINSGYAGQMHPAGVEFTSQGFPDFSPHSVAQVELDGLTGNIKTDSMLANEAMGYPSTPEGFTWHHVEDGTTLQLVPQKIHQTVRHTGGAAVIKNGGFDP